MTRLPVESPKVHLVSTLEGMEVLRNLWIRNNTNADADFEVYQLYLRERSHTTKPYILAASEGDELTAILIGRSEEVLVPFRLGYRPLFDCKTRQLTFLQDGFLGDCCSRIAQAMISEVISRLRHGDADQALFERVATDTDLSQFARRCPKLFLRDFSNHLTETWHTALPSTMEEFLNRRSKKHRYWLRRIGRVFEEQFKGNVRYQVYTHPNEVEPFCVSADRVARSTYQRGLGVGFADTIQNRRKLELAARQGWLRGYIAFVGQEPVAFWCGQLYRGVMGLEWTGYNPDYRKYELGTVLFLKMVEDLCASGAREIDYGSGTSFYKERFGDLRRERRMVHIYAPTLRAFRLNLLRSGESGMNRLVKSLAGKLGVLDAIKKRWRGRLVQREVDVS